MHVANVVANQIAGDGRVLRTGQSASRRRLETTCFGLDAKRQDKRMSLIEGLTSILYPLAPENNQTDRWMKTAKMMAADVARLRCHILHTHDMAGLLLGHGIQWHLSQTSMSIPWVHDVHEDTNGLTHVPRERLKFFIDVETKFIREPDRLIAVNSTIADALVRRYSLSTSPMIIPNYPFAHRRTSRTSRLRETLNLGRDKFLMVYSGTIKAERGLSVPVEALPHLDANVHLALVGDTSKASGLLKMASDLGVQDRVHAVPCVESDRVTEFLSDADIGLHPGLRYPNMDVALPTKLFEYMHADLPVLTSDATAMKAFVSETNIGLTFEAGSTASFVEAVLLMQFNLQSHHKAITEELKLAHSWETNESRLIRIYEDLECMAGSRSEGSGTTAERKLRIIHGYGGSAGQPGIVSSAQRTAGYQARSVEVFANKFGYPANYSFRLSEWGTEALTNFLSDRADVFHIYSRPLSFSWANIGEDSGSDLVRLRAAGKTLVWSMRGSEARLHSRFRALSPFHYVDDNPEDIIDRIPEDAQKWWIQFAEEVSDVVTVPDNELKSYVPNAQIVPRAIDVSLLEFVGVHQRRRPLIVHAPTQPVIKGTSHVRRALRQLHAEGYEFEYRQVEGMPHTQALEIFREADIVIDQLRIGYYGVLAAEAMALGKIVVSFIRDDLVSDLSNVSTGMPLVNASPVTLVDRLRELLEDPTSWLTRSRVAREYAVMVHSASRVANDLVRIYEEARARPSYPNLGVLTGLLSSTNSDGSVRQMPEANVRSDFVQRTDNRNLVRRSNANFARLMKCVWTKIPRGWRRRIRRNLLK